MKEVKFKVFRFDPEKDKNFHFDTFVVPTRPGMTVLEGLLYIRENIDSSLAFRTSCRAGVCGSCAMHINGRYRLACETQISVCGNIIRIRPLAHLNIIKDLVVDMTPFWKKYKFIKPYLIPGNPNPVDIGGKERIQTQDEREKLTGIIDCILCGCCYAACPMTATHEEYLGPAAFLKANRFFLDTRDNADEERLKLVASEEHGVWRCHTIFNCQKACPKELDPAGAIANLKMNAIFRKKK
jgi:succinate dehydrogenase / fumarate reductase iron-sulfur subunit